MNFIKKKSDFDLSHIVDPLKDCAKYIKSSNEKKFTRHLYDDSIVRADFNDFLISILFNTNNIDKSVSIIKKFFEKTTDPEKIQFCIKIDNDDMNFQDNFLKEMSKFKFNFVILSSPKGRGFIDLWQWINYLFKVSSKNSKFVLNISDEMYVEEKGWDKNLEKYVGLEKDNLYRLRTSVYKNRNYHDLWECGYAPDTTAIYTRKYISLQGNFSPCFGPDNGQQIVAYYLSKLNYPRHTQFLRDKVINDISFKGQGTNIGLTEEQLRNRRNLNHLLWLNIFTYKNQTDYFQRARKIQVEIIKQQFKNSNFKEYDKKYILSYFTKDNKDNKIKNNLHLTKQISYLKLFFYNISRYDFFKYNTGYYKNKFPSVIFTLYFLINKKFILFKEKKSNDKLINLLIGLEKNIRSIFHDYVNKLLFEFHCKYFNQKEKIDSKILELYQKYILNIENKKRNFFGWGIHDKIINILGKIYYVLYKSVHNTLMLTYYTLRNITFFILFYIRLSMSIFIWLSGTLVFLILFWKFLHFFRYLSGRYISFKSRDKSIIVIDNNEQSQSLIIKGD